MRIRSFALASAMAMVAGSALAADIYRPAPAPVLVAPAPAPSIGGLYVSLHGGALWVPETDVDFVGGPGTFSTDTGYRLGGSVGYDFNSMFGIEVEGSYGRVNVSDLDIIPGIPGGNASVTSVMGNLIIGQSFGAWRPYVGVGAGWANVDLDVDIGGGDGVRASDGTWAAQAFVGLDFNLTRNVSLGGRYRFQYVGQTNFSDLDGDPINIDSLTAHSAELVLKVRFN